MEHDDVMKARLGIDERRSATAFDHCCDGLDALRDVLNAGYINPSDREVGDRYPEIRDRLRSGDIEMVVPMGEDGPVIRPLLATLVGYHKMPKDAILVVSDGAGDEALTEAMSHGVKLVHRDEVFKCVRWDRLLPIVNLPNPPRRRGGKGWAVLAGYLTQYARRLKASWLAQSDAEIAEYPLYHCMERLVYGLLVAPSAEYIKLGKFGRTNERCMTARWMLMALANSSALSPARRRRAQELAYRMGSHKWMLCGEFMLTWDLAMGRPFASGYLEETLITARVEDGVAAGKLRGVGTVQVANPHPRMDAANTLEKEAVMQQLIANFLVQLALDAEPVDTWGLEQIKEYNHGFMAQPLTMGWIPNDDGPVKSAAVNGNRIIPSVTMLVENDLVDLDRLRAMVA